MFELDGLAIPLLFGLAAGLVIWLVWWLLVGRQRKLRRRRIEQGMDARC